MSDNKKRALEKTYEGSIGFWKIHAEDLRDQIEKLRRLHTELIAARAVIEAARATEKIYWNFDKSMKAEVEALREALAAYDAAEKRKWYE